MAWGMVHSSFHKQGFGKALFEYRVEQINSKYPGRSITLDTTQHTYQFFEKQGFSTVQIRKDFYDKGLDRYDMAKKLTHLSNSLPVYLVVTMPASSPG